MLFHKSLVSFVAAIALASSVTASATPARRDDQSCSTGSLTCCQSSSSFEDLPSFLQELLGVLDPNLNLALPVGLECALTGTLGCNNEAFCCSGTQDLGGLVDVGLNCVSL